MILEHIRLRGFGRFAEERRFPAEGDFDLRIHVLAGENEVGKTTLFTALHHALFTPYTSTAREIKALQPWGTELAPRIEVHFRHGDERYRLVKAFLHEATCQLAVWQDGRYQPLADGDRADDRLRQFWLGEKPHGAAEEKHRGLARLLWIPQGPPKAVALEGELRSRVEASLGAITLDPAETELQERIAARFGTWWTAKGNLKKTSALAAAAHRVEDLRARVQSLASELRRLDELNERLRIMRQKRDAIERRSAELQEAAKHLEAEARRIEAIRTELAKARSRLETCEERFKAAERRRAEFQQARQIDWETTLLLAERQPLRERLTAEMQEAQLAWQQAEAEVEQTAEAVRRAEQAWQRGRRLQQAQEWLRQSDGLQKRLEQVEALVREYEEQRKAVDNMPAPTQEMIAAARQLEAELLHLSGRLEAVGLQLRFQPEKPMDVEFAADGAETEKRTVAAAETISFTAARRARLELPGIGVLEVRSGAREAEAVGRELTEKRERLTALLQSFGAADTADLARMYDARERLLEQRWLLKQRIEAALQPYAAVSDLRAAAAAARRQAEAVALELGHELSELAAIPAPDMARLEAAFEAARAAEAEKRRSMQKHMRRLEALRERLNAEQQREIELQTKRQQARDRMQALIQEAGTEAAIEAAYHDCRREWDAAQAQAAELERQLPDHADDPMQRLEHVQATLRQLSGELADLNQKEIFCLAEIRQVTERGTHEELAALEEELATAEAAYEKEWREARAIKLLRRLIEERQKSVTRSLTEPVAERVTRYFARVSGHAERDVQFDAALKPALISEREAQGISPEALSAGAQEQMHILTRLALARYLAQTEGRMLFVLDDTLVHTDPLRHRRFLEILEEAADDLQIIILTCHGERFRSLNIGRFETIYK